MQSETNRVVEAGKRIFAKFVRIGKTGAADSISAQYLARAVKDLYFLLDLPAPSENEVSNILAEVKSGEEVPAAKFVQWWSKTLEQPAFKEKIPAPNSEGEAVFEAKALFLLYDVDDSKNLDVKEFSLLLSDLFLNLGYGEVAPPVVRRAVQALDVDGDGQISYEEFLPWWKKTYLEHHQKGAH